MQVSFMVHRVQCNETVFAQSFMKEERKVVEFSKKSLKIFMHFIELYTSYVEERSTNKVFG